MKEGFWDAIVIGGGIAGLSAAIYLGRAQRRVLVIDSGNSMARWEPRVQNYLGYPQGISGPELLRRGKKQAGLFRAKFAQDEVVKATRRKSYFSIVGRKKIHHTPFVLLATGIDHIPPDITGVNECLGRSMFFCKDCDGTRVRGRRIAIYGANNEAAEYALAMLLYSRRVVIVTDGRPRRWSERHARWLREHQIPVHTRRVRRLIRARDQVQRLELDNDFEIPVDALFTTRGDIYHNELARMLGAKIFRNEIVIDRNMRTTVPGLYAAGCVTPANCQMIIAAGQGATAAQSINRKLFETSLATHSLKASRRTRRSP